MSGTRQGALKGAARRIGISQLEYQSKIDAGQKRCSGCDTWRPISEFGKDSSRGDGLSTVCYSCRKKRYDETYVPVPADRRKKSGPQRIPRRPGDKLQARSRINHDVKLGIIPHPNDLACVDCGHIGDDRRHEYDHRLGYEPEHHYEVDAVCSACHHRRADARHETWYSKGR